MNAAEVLDRQFRSFVRHSRKRDHGILREDVSKSKFKLLLHSSPGLIVQLLRLLLEFQCSIPGDPEFKFCRSLVLGRSSENSVSPTDNSAVIMMVIRSASVNSLFIVTPFPCRVGTPYCPGFECAHQPETTKASATSLEWVLCP